MFICREYMYVMEFAPTTLKGVSKLDMQAKIKEKQEGSKQVVTKPTHSATLIISNQAEFDAWFQSLNAGPQWGNLRIVNPMIAPTGDERGLCKGLGGEFATDDIQQLDGEAEESGEFYFAKVACEDNCADVFTKPMVNMVTPRSEVSSPLDVARATRPHLRSPLTLGVESAPPNGSFVLSCAAIGRAYRYCSIVARCAAAPGRFTLLTSRLSQRAVG